MLASVFILLNVFKPFNPGMYWATFVALEIGRPYWTKAAVISPIPVSVSGILKNPSLKNLSNFVRVSVSRAKSIANAGICNNPFTAVPRPFAGAWNTISVK
jgi:hypothetical protein